MQKQSENIEQLLRKIADMLIINGSLLGNSGLWYGKTGVAIFFFHYAQYTGNELFEDYAVEIISAIKADIHMESPSGYNRGLAGIGSGIEYLAQNGFLNIDTNVILEDFDKRMRHEIMYKQQENNSLANGLTGLGQYLLSRLYCLTAESNEIHLLINQELMMHLVNILENDKNTLPDDLPDILSFLCRLYSLNICNLKIDRYMDKILKDFSLNDISDEQAPASALAALRLTSLSKQSIDFTCQIINRVLQTIDTDELTAVNNIFIDETNRLLWLFQCKKLIKQTGICVDFNKRIDNLIDRIFRQKDDELHLEKGKLSLKGCAGFGLAIMTVSGMCDDSWLDLL